MLNRIFSRICSSLCILLIDNIIHSAVASFSRDVTLSSTSLGVAVGQTSFIELVLILEQSVEELFSQTLLTFAKTWEEMKAVKSDFSKVAKIVHEQVHLSLTNGDRLDSLDKFRRSLIANDYKRILEIRERKHNDELMEEASESVKQLKEHLREQIVDLVKEQRISLIEKEFKFHDNPNKKKEV